MSRWFLSNKIDYLFGGSLMSIFFVTAFKMGILLIAIFVHKRVLKYDY